MLGNYVVFFMFIMGIILAENDGRKWLYNNTQKNWNSQIRNSQILVLFG